MKRVWILLAVAMIAANSVGCCCRRLCPWFDRGASCCPLAPATAPLVASPAPVCCPPAAPQYAPQFATPLAAPMAATPMAAPMVAPVAQSACPPPCTYWDPCQNAVVAQPGAGFAQQPIMMAPAAMSYAEPNCGFAMEPACGEPYIGEVSYGPSFTSDCATCAPGAIVSEGTFSAPAPETFNQPQNTDPRPTAEQ